MLYHKINSSLFIIYIYVILSTMIFLCHNFTIYFIVFIMISPRHILTVVVYFIIDYLSVAIKHIFISIHTSFLRIIINNCIIFIFYPSSIHPVWYPLKLHLNIWQLFWLAKKVSLDVLLYWIFLKNVFAILILASLVACYFADIFHLLLIVVWLKIMEALLTRFAAFDSAFLFYSAFPWASSFLFSDFMVLFSHGYSFRCFDLAVLSSNGSSFVLITFFVLDGSVLLFSGCFFVSLSVTLFILKMNLKTNFRSPHIAVVSHLVSYHFFVFVLNLLWFPFLVPGHCRIIYQLSHKK